MENEMKRFMAVALGSTMLVSPAFAWDSYQSGGRWGTGAPGQTDQSEYTRTLTAQAIKTYQDMGGIGSGGGNSKSNNVNGSVTYMIITGNNNQVYGNNLSSVNSGKVDGTGVIAGGSVGKISTVN